MARPKQYCFDCGLELVYDKHLSKKHHHTVWWCMDCNNIEYIEKFNVHNAINSIRRFIFHGNLIYKKPKDNKKD